MRAAGLSVGAAGGGVALANYFFESAKLTSLDEFFGGLGAFIAGAQIGTELYEAGAKGESYADAVAPTAGLVAAILAAIPSSYPALAPTLATSGPFAPAVALAGVALVLQDVGQDQYLGNQAQKYRESACYRYSVLYWKAMRESWQKADRMVECRCKNVR